MGRGERVRKRPVLAELEALLGPIDAAQADQWTAAQLADRLVAAKLEIDGIDFDEQPTTSRASNQSLPSSASGRKPKAAAVPSDAVTDDIGAMKVIKKKSKSSTASIDHDDGDEPSAVVTVTVTDRTSTRKTKKSKSAVDGIAIDGADNTESTKTSSIASQDLADLVVVVNDSHSNGARHESDGTTSTQRKKKRKVQREDDDEPASLPSPAPAPSPPVRPARSPVIQPTTLSPAVRPVAPLPAPSASALPLQPLRMPQPLPVPMPHPAAVPLGPPSAHRYHPHLALAAVQHLAPAPTNGHGSSDDKLRTAGMEEIDIDIDDDDDIVAPAINHAASVQPVTRSTVTPLRHTHPHTSTNAYTRLRSSTSQLLEDLSNDIPAPSSHKAVVPLMAPTVPAAQSKRSLPSPAPMNRGELVSVLQSIQNTDTQSSFPLLPDSILASRIKSTIVFQLQTLLLIDEWQAAHLTLLTKVFSANTLRPTLAVDPLYIDSDIKEMLLAIVDLLILYHQEKKIADMTIFSELVRVIVLSKDRIGMSASQTEWANELIATMNKRPHATKAALSEVVGVKRSNKLAVDASSSDSNSESDSNDNSSSGDDSDDESDSDDDTGEVINPVDEDELFDSVNGLPLEQAVKKAKPPFVIVDAVNVGRWGGSGGIFDSLAQSSSVNGINTHLPAHTHSNNLPPFHSWQLLAAVKAIEKQLDVPARCYIPETFLRSPHSVGVTDIEPLKQLFSLSKLFWLPSGADDDRELIALAKKYKTWIVTNDNFRDYVYHGVIDKKFTSQRCIKYYSTMLPVSKSGKQRGIVHLIDPSALKKNRPTKFSDATEYDRLGRGQQQHAAMAPISHYPPPPSQYHHYQHQPVPSYGVPFPPGFPPGPNHQLPRPALPLPRPPMPHAQSPPPGHSQPVPPFDP